MIMATVTDGIINIDTEDESITTVRLTGVMTTTAWDAAITTAGFRRVSPWIFRGADGNEVQTVHSDDAVSADCEVVRQIVSVVDAAIAGTPRGYSWRLSRVNQRREPLQYQLTGPDGLTVCISRLADGRWSVDFYIMINESQPEITIFNGPDRAIASVNMIIATQL